MPAASQKRDDEKDTDRVGSGAWRGQLIAMESLADRPGTGTVAEENQPERKVWTQAAPFSRECQINPGVMWPLQRGTFEVKLNA